MSVWLGLGASVIGSILMGSLYVPVRSYPMGDGLAVHLFLCLGALITSIVIHLILDNPVIQPWAMLGGVLCSIGNVLAVPTMNRIGMALSTLISSTVSCLVGWATSRYGFYGLPAEVPYSIPLNYIGIIILLFGGFVYVFVKSNPASQQAKKTSLDLEEVGNRGSYCPATGEEVMESAHKVTMIDRIVGLLGAVVAGCCFGGIMTPVTYIQSFPSEFNNASPDGLSYLLSVFLGMICSAVILFIVYIAVKRNRPSLPPSLVAPSLFCGVIHCLGMACFLLSSQHLSQAICYPVMTKLPALVVSLWSVCYFKEIEGRRNIYILAIAYISTVVGVIAITLSKEQFF